MIIVGTRNGRYALMTDTTKVSGQVCGGRVLRAFNHRCILPSLTLSSSPWPAGPACHPA
jgi:hypothetical protein